jgi:hypothetical protein
MASQALCQVNKDKNRALSWLDELKKQQLQVSLLKWKQLISDPEHVSPAFLTDLPLLFLLVSHSKDRNWHSIHIAHT